jgi:hypothetical protein
MSQSADALIDPICTGPLPGQPVVTLGAFDLERQGYVTEEWLLEGMARSWRGKGALDDDGRWETEVNSTCPYKTRIIVCRPASSVGFSGTVVVEWLNVSGGGDGSPDWFFIHRQMMRQGAAWVGVSAQKAGIDGGAFFDSGQHLKAVAPMRYGELSHPGDAFSFDIFSQAASTLRAGSGPLAGFQLQTILAVGESQSAMFLVTYVNAVDHHDRVYDGYLIHGRGSSGVSLDAQMLSSGGSEDAETAVVSLESATAMFTGRQWIREDVRVPVMTVQSETDLVMMAGIRGRQPDSERFRWWEIAGAAHFDSYGLIASQQDDGSLDPGELAALMAPVDEVFEMKMSGLINSGPQQHYVLNAAIAHLETWARSGTPPPGSRWIENDPNDELMLLRDEAGNVRGGVRTPWVDVPLAVLSGQGGDGDMFLPLFGTTIPFDQGQVKRLYPGGVAQYLERFESRLDGAIEAGFILEADRREILGVAAKAFPVS